MPIWAAILIASAIAGGIQTWQTSEQKRSSDEAEDLQKKQARQQEEEIGRAKEQRRIQTEEEARLRTEEEARASSEMKRLAEQKLKRGAGGRKYSRGGTILTSPLGVPTETSAGVTKTLLGA